MLTFPDFPTDGALSIKFLLDALNDNDYVQPSRGESLILFKHGAVHVKKSAAPPWAGNGKEPNGWVKFIQFWSQEGMEIAFEKLEAMESEWWVRDVMVWVKGEMKGVRRGVDEAWL